MSDLRKAAEMALVTLEEKLAILTPTKYEETIKALRQALAQPEWVCCVCGEPEALGIVHSADAPCFHYTKREWVGLTDEEKHQLNDALNLQGRFPIIEAIEAKLKEKNT